MNKSDDMQRLIRDLSEQPELQEKLNAEIKRVTEDGEAECDGEAMAKAAAALGYAVTAQDLERAAADMEKLDDDELEAAGGLDPNRCTTNYQCRKFWHNNKEDENGHDNSCTTVWHCFVASMHSDSEKDNVACWKDYKCVIVNKNVKIV